MMYPKCVPNKFEALPVPPTHMEVRIGAMLCEVGHTITCICKENKLGDCLLRSKIKFTDMKVY